MMILKGKWHEISSNINFYKSIYEIAQRQYLQGWSGCITHINGYSDSVDKIHHSQVTVKRDIFESVWFPEEEEFNRIEDC